MSLPVKSRVAIPKAVRESVLAEFNHRCEICGADRPQLHHLDENPANNTPENLLPLCANHHLTDQHNPTRAHEPRKLAIFRQYKDPAILKPQFQPIYDRLKPFFRPACELKYEEISEAAVDLIKFVGELHMGNYYAAKLTELISAIPFASPSVFNVLDDQSIRRMNEERKRSQDAYLLSIENSQSEVIRLVVELLRYQEWSESQGTT
jgi:hypothetical protein